MYMECVHTWVELRARANKAEVEIVEDGTENVEVEEEDKAGVGICCKFSREDLIVEETTNKPERE